MRVWTTDGYGLYLDQKKVAHFHLDVTEPDDMTAQFIVDACNAAEQRPTMAEVRDVLKMPPLGDTTIDEARYFLFGVDKIAEKP